MKVDISSIYETRGGMVSFEGKQEIETEKELKVELNQPVVVKGTVTNTGNGFLVQGEVIYTYRTNCDRCLGAFNGSQKAEVIEEFASYLPTETEEPTYVVQGNLVDLSDCVREQVLLSLPMKFTCKADCRGLCPQCGQNLNQKECGCLIDNFNPQFDKLKSLLNQEGGGSNGKPKK